MATSRGFGEFSRRMRVRGDELEFNVDKLIRKIGIVADQAIVLATPVDTGAARSNWIVRIGEPTSEIIEPYSPGEHLGLGEGANAQGAIQQALAAIALRQPGQPISIANNLPYIGRLNEGYSQQAPAMFVETAVKQAAVAVVQATFFPSA